MGQTEIGRKREALIRRLEAFDALLVAFSGGVDSTFLLAMAHSVLGDKVTAATALSLTHPLKEREEAEKFTRERGIEHILFQSDEFTIPEFVANDRDRCYHCKRAIAGKLFEIAKEKGISSVADGANLDDMSDYRPGLKAAREAGIISPLVDVSLGKEEIRRLSKEMGLPTWDKPAMACLASRIPYGTPISREKLEMVAAGEAVLHRHGFIQCRVRHHGAIARIEVDPEDMPKITQPGIRDKIVNRFRKIGFLHIACDLEGYISGSMNRALEDEE